MKIHEEFKLYENLWEDTNDTYYRVLGRKKYNLLDDKELDDYLEAGAKLIHRSTSTKSHAAFKRDKASYLLYYLRGNRTPDVLIRKVQAIYDDLADKTKSEA